MAIFMVCWIKSSQNVLVNRYKSLEELQMINGCSDEFTMIHDELLRELKDASGACDVCFSISIAVAVLILLNYLLCWLVKDRDSLPDNDHDE